MPDTTTTAQDEADQPGWWRAGLAVGVTSPTPVEALAFSPHTVMASRWSCRCHT